MHNSDQPTLSMLTIDTATSTLLAGNHIARVTPRAEDMSYTLARLAPVPVMFLPRPDTLLHTLFVGLDILYKDLLVYHASVFALI